MPSRVLSRLMENAVVIRVVVMATLYLTLILLAGHLIHWIVIIVLTLNLWISQDSPNLDSSKCELVTLPSYQPVASPTFHWGLKEASVVIQALESAYDETIHWRKNCLLCPMDLLVRA